jgi:hypothetical protein
VAACTVSDDGDGIMFAAIKKKLIIRGYREKLGPYLRKHYGPRGPYSPNQVLVSVTHLGMAKDFLHFAQAMFCDKKDFDAFNASIGESYDYDSLRAQMRLRKAGTGSGGLEGSWPDNSPDSTSWPGAD